MKQLQDSQFEDGKRRTRIFTLPRVGPLVEDLHRELRARLEREIDASVVLKDSADWTGKQGMTVLRAKGRMDSGHEVFSDIVFARRGDNAILQVVTEKRSLLKAMHTTLKTTVVLVLWAVIYGMFLRETGSTEALVREYVSHWSGSSVPVDMREAKLGGILYDPRTGQFYQGPKITVWEILRRDPKLFLMSMGGPPTLILGALWGLMALLPKSAWTRISHGLRWPTVEEYEAFCGTHSAFVEVHVGEVAAEFLKRGRIEVQGESVEDAPPGFGG